MTEPRPSRPFMPGYGIAGPDEGRGLLPWSWAVERLTASPNYWVSTVSADGRPHTMPVWGIWDDGAVWFSSSRRSRRIRQLLVDPACAVTTQDPLEPVVLEGVGEIITEPASIARFLDRLNAKYGTAYGLDFQDPAVNATVRVTPHWVFGLDNADFTGSPTRWQFDEPAARLRARP